MQISVVIPTCGRKARLLSLLQSLNNSSYPLDEVIVVDSGNDRLSPAEYLLFEKLDIHYIISEKSVCIQRNKGIAMAKSPWIFLCDDDIEIPDDYLQKLADHVNVHPEAGAVSGQWLEKQHNGWKATHPVQSARMLLWKYIFQLGIWEEINYDNNNIVIKRIRRYYQRKGNHITKAGWPVNTDFGGNYTLCPVYSLGASLVKKEWLLHSPYDEVLDRYGIGDNYGVIAGFPIPGVHVLTAAFVYHHHEPANRLERPLQYYRRVLALDYFAKTRPGLQYVKRYCILWSLTGNLLMFLKEMNGEMIRAAAKAMWKIVFNNNPYFIASKRNLKIREPML